MIRILPPAWFHEEKISATDYVITITAPNVHPDNKPVEYGRASVCYIECFPLEELRIDDPDGDGYIEAYYVASLDIWHPYQRRGYGRALIKHIERRFGHILPVAAISTNKSDPFWRATGWRRNIDVQSRNNVYSHHTELIALQRP